MPWKEQTNMSQRKEFIQHARKPERNMRRLCQEYGISRKTGYKWLGRYQAEGVPGLAERSRKPHHSPNRTDPEIEQVVLAVRQQHPTWGGRKIRRRLEDLGHQNVPSASTITAILHRHSYIDLAASRKRQAFKQFEMEKPNQLWQMDFKGPFRINGKKCSPLTVLDDHSRYLVGLKACINQQGETVKDCLTEIFDCYGLPDAFLTDNGSPWGTSSAERRYTKLNAWMFRLKIKLIHSRPYHPQTIGKDERLHRTLKADVLKQHTFEDFSTCQRRFSAWRKTYNHIRPHEALDLDVPASCYQPSHRTFPEKLPPVEYHADDYVRKVHDGGRISFQGKLYRVGQAFDGFPVAVRQTETDGVFDVYFCEQNIRTLSLLKVQC